MAASARSPSSSSALVSKGDASDGGAGAADAATAAGAVSMACDLGGEADATAAPVRGGGGGGSWEFANDGKEEFEPIRWSPSIKRRFP